MNRAMHTYGILQKVFMSEYFLSKLPLLKKLRAFFKQGCMEALILV
jgi:hypothetical protein